MSVVTPRVQPRRTLAIDFDGVVHAYSQGWHGGKIYDEPVPGVTEALRELDKRFELVLFTARHDLAAVHLWLIAHRLRQFFHELTNRKPAAAAYIDDRAIRFHNWDQTLAEVLAL